MLTEKKNAQPKKFRAVFYSVDKTEDLNPGHSISDNSKRARWGVRIYRLLFVCLFVYNKGQVLGGRGRGWLQSLIV